MTNFWKGLSKMVGLLRCSPFFPNSLSPTWMMVFLTSPSSSSVAWRTLTSLHLLRGTSSSFRRTMSPAYKLHRGTWHLCLRVMIIRYSFLYRFQNCSERYWICLHIFLVCMSLLTNVPGGGKGTADFMFRRWLGVKGSRLLWSLIVLILKGRIFKMDIAS